ncbi:acyltransferase family protein [Vibrio cholerae]|uniref:acyltransferase family protein n=1 Tax=Vibrio cholerae TaxID=666 RepID=UPI000BA91F11|nr:acyltransferase [Vibrio cholerae]EGR1402297.1 acyltransferase [Vibrio cholerae]EGR1428808.1 acyltransferase [Vibrio cholerae]PAR78286.1 hypothetical protein CGT87_12085 [Vibrio cholerae]
MIIKEFLHVKNNNLTLIRVVLACLVIYYHSYALTGNDPDQDIVKSFVGITTSGGLAVAMFFFISGMLVSDSYIKDLNPIRFFLSRFFRVIPALFFTLLLTVFILAPIVTNVTLKEFFSEKSNYFYIMNNLIMDTRYYLLGVFEDNHYKSVVNGSIWTLKWEVVFYFFLWCFGMIGLLKDRTLSTIFFVFIILSSFLKLDWLVSLLSDNVGILYLPMYFSIGCLFAIWKDKIFISFSTVFGFSLLSFLLNGSIFFDISFYVSVFSFVVYISSRDLIRKLRLNNDSSYGVYIYGFPVQQLLVFYYPSMGYYANSFFSIIICLILGYLSFKYIEKPCIDFGRFLFKPSQ